MTKCVEVWLLILDFTEGSYTLGSHAQIFTDEESLLRWLWADAGQGDQPDNLADWAAGDEETGCCAPGVTASWGTWHLPLDKLKITEEKKAKVQDA